VSETMASKGKKKQTQKKKASHFPKWLKVVTEECIHWDEKGTKAGKKGRITCEQDGKGAGPAGAEGGTSV